MCAVKLGLCFRSGGQEGNCLQGESESLKCRKDGGSEREG